MDLLEEYNRKAVNMSKVQTVATGVEADLSSSTFYSNTQPKRLVIDLDFHTPRYAFEGSWTGKDIRIVTNQLRRAYVGYKQNLIRQATEQEAALSTKSTDKEQ